MVLKKANLVVGPGQADETTAEKKNNFEKRATKCEMLI